MDPALHELLRAEEEAGEDRVIEAIIRLARPGIEIPDVRMVARFGTIATCRLLARDVVAVHDRDDVLSLKAPRRLGASLEPDRPEPPDPPQVPQRPTDVRRPPGLDVTGRGVVVASVDWGVDVASAALRAPEDGGTRFLALWDQRDAALGPRPQPYGYGAIHDRAAIDRALRGGRPYEDLGFHPAVADRGTGSHGQHVLDIAAGNGRAGAPVGIAPDADLVSVHLADRDTGGVATLGDSVRLLEAVHFVATTAGELPWVVNLSLGRIGGPHDGCSPAELALDELLAAAPGGFAVQSSGNYLRTRTHAGGRLEPGEVRTLRFVSRPGDVTPDELEIWYSGVDEFAVRIDPPGATAARPVLLGERAELVHGGRVLGRVYHRAGEPNSHANHVDAFLDPLPGGGEWTVTLEARHVVDGRFDAWIERDDSCSQCQARFRPADTSTTSTTGTIANGRLPLVVGAYDSHDPERPPARFSSVGPTRDGRAKPDLCAPGVDVLAARSTPLGGDPDAGLLVRKSGTSMATPHVTGAVALCLELGGRALDAAIIRRLVLDSCEPVPATDPPNRLGAGRLDIARLVTAARLHLGPPPEEHPMNDDTASILQSPDTLYRECLYRPDGDFARTVRERFEVVGGPGDRVDGRPGDVLVQVRLGRPGGRTAVLDDANLRADLGAGAGPLPHGRLLLRPRNLLDAGVRTGTDLAGQEDARPGEEPALTRLIDKGLAESKITDELFYARNRQLAGRKLKPGTAAARDWQRMLHTEVRPALRARRLAAARDVWSDVAAGDPVLTLVTVHPKANAPSCAVRDSSFAAWTNSPTAVYIDAERWMTDFGIEQILTHESVHVRQFAASSRKRPGSYAEMVRYELEAYGKDVDRLSAVRKDPEEEKERQDYLKQARTNVSKLERIRRDSCTGTDPGAGRKCKLALVAADLLPEHTDLDELYAPRGRQRNPSAEESEDWDDAESIEDDLLGEVMALGALDTEDDDEEDEPSAAEFAGSEHKDIGDQASGTEPTAIPFGDPPRPLTFGDVVSMAGDYYESYEQMRDLGRTPQGRAELEWARWDCLGLGRQKVAEPTVDDPVKQRVRERYLLLAARNLSHFSAGGTAWQAYSLWHGKAIADALEAGQRSDDAVWRRALTKEAFGDHFLTDVFSAGHVRTPRADMRDWYVQHHPDSSDKFVAHVARYVFDRLDERQQLPPLLWWFGWVTRSMMADRVRSLGGPAVASFSLGDIVSLALHDHDNEGLDVVSDVDPDGHPVSGGYRWRAVGDAHLHRSPAGARTKAMASAGVIGSLRDLERVRGVGVRLGTGQVPAPRKADEIRGALGADGFAARRFVPRVDPASSTNLPLRVSGGGRAPLEWRWGQLGDAAYQAVDKAVKERIAGELRGMAGRVTDPISTPVGRVYGIRAAFLAFVQHLRDDGITVVEAAVGSRAR